MVKRGVVLFLLLLLSLAGLAAPRARGAAYALDRDTLALGEPLQLRLARAVGAGGSSLESLDLTPLQRDFEILERTLGRDSAQETLTLTLYARRSGRIELPALGLPGKAPRLTVTDGSERVPRVRWQLSLDPPEPLLRQPTTFTLEACDDGTLLWQRPALPAVEGLLLRPLNETEIITTRDGQRCTAHRWHWALLPTASGALRLPLPVVQASKFGTRLRYTPPALELLAQPLPAWLPAEAAVGQVEFVAEPLPAQAAINEPLAWRLQVTGSYSEQALLRLLALQLSQADQGLGLDSYAPRIETLATSTFTSTAAPRQRITLYMRPSQRGTLDLPQLQLPWFDPASARLMQARLAPAHIEVTDPSRQRWLRLAGALGASLLVLVLLRAAGRWLGWRLRRRVARRALLRAPDAQALRRELLAFSLVPGLPAAPTLGAWRERMARQCASPHPEELLRSLERACYGGGQLEPDPALARLRALAVDWLRQLRPLRPHRRVFQFSRCRNSSSTLRSSSGSTGLASRG